MSKDYSRLLPALKRRLPAAEVDALGSTTAFIQRVRVVTASLFVWSVVLSRFGNGRPGFEQARRWFERLSRQLFPRPFQMRFKSPRAVALFEATFEQAVAPWRKHRSVAHPLGKLFPDIFIWDATPVQLDDSLRKFFKGLRMAASQVKVLLGISAFGLVPLAARIVPGHLNDSQLGPPVETLRKGTLVLFDNAFVTYDRLRSLDTAGMKYLCRMRIHAHAWITKVHAGPSRLFKALKNSPSGIDLRDVLSREKRIGKPWDIEVLMRPKSKDADPTPVAMRLVIVPGPKGEQRPYLTNLDTCWSPAALAELYRLRWQIELVFKELKQDLNLRSVPTKDPHAAQVLLWASLIALAVSRTVASTLGPIINRPGFAAPLRPAVVSRALRSNVHALGLALVANSRAVEHALIRSTQSALLDAIRPKSRRKDTFARLEKLAPPILEAA